MTLELAAGVSCERAVGHHLQTYGCESQRARKVVRVSFDELARMNNEWVGVGGGRVVLGSLAAPK